MEKDEVVLMDNGIVVFNEQKPFFKGIRKVVCKAKDIKAGNALKIVAEANKLRKC